ncbi:MAG: hypothetical protein ABI539_08165, partial [Acidobacteriota bacterium]
MIPKIITPTGAHCVFFIAAEMIVQLWGTRGSLASSGPDTVRYGGNTASVEIVGADGAILALDA